MKLGHSIADEMHVEPEKVILLRHSDGMLQLLRRHGGMIDAYTLVQPANTPYDYLAKEKPPVFVVVVASDEVYAVYEITGEEATGPTRSLISQALRNFYDERHYPEKPAKRFSGERRESRFLGRAVEWPAKRTAVARSRGKLFDKVTI